MPGPLPPANLAGRALPFVPLPAGSALFRIHRREHGPIFFGRTGDNRFDDPAHVYGVLYAGISPAGAFAEVFLREPGRTLLPRSDVERRQITILATTRDLKLAMMTGRGLVRLGATAAIASGHHEHAQAWSAAIHAHPLAVDGIVYRSRHDDDEHSVALFDRCEADLLVARPPLPVWSAMGLGDILGRYGIGIDPLS